MTDLSKEFTYFKSGTELSKDITVKNLRKTYLNWQHEILGDDTGLVSSHSTKQVLEKYYLDQKF